MPKTNTHITRLISIRNKYGAAFATEKTHLLQTINLKKLTHKNEIRSYYEALLFLIAYPDNKTIYTLASRSLKQVQLYLQSNESMQRSLYNSGVTNTSLCAAFSFEVVKWLRRTHPETIRFSSFEADDGQIGSILSVVMPKVESEILQDGNADWREWLEQSMKEGETLLDKLIGVFDRTTIRSEVKEEFWNTIGINVEIDLPTHCTLSGNLVKPCYHRSLIRKDVQEQPFLSPVKLKITEARAAQIIDASRMILIRHLREIDPVSFTAPKYVSYYRLQRGLTVALTGMVPEYRHPVDSYMSYVVFKNGVPVGYAACWILFNSGRIGLNVFPAYRGGESQYIFEQVLKLHAKVYNLKRFSVDPYQLGKDNYDGIHSGVFWVYYHAGFRPLDKALRELADAEALKISSTPGYRSPATVLKKLANSRLELVLQKNAVCFDATELSRAHAAIINKRSSATDPVKKLANILQIKNYADENMNYVLQNWCSILLSKETALRRNAPLKRSLKKIFELKVGGNEEEQIRLMQRSQDLRDLVEEVLREYVVDQL